MDVHEEDAAKKNDDSTAEELIGSIAKSADKPCSPSPRLLGTSRYGRLIKPKSPSNVMLDSTKNLKMPKNAKPEASIEDESTKMEDTSSVMDDTINNSLDCSSIRAEEDSIDIEDLQSQCPWTLGQIVWSRIGTYPFWPSIVTLHPETMTYVSQRGAGLVKTKIRSVHVTFCADKGKRSWVSFGNIIPFHGIADFEKRKEEITPEIKKKEPKYAAAFVIKPSMKLKWDDAVAEASGLMAKSPEARIEIFKPKNSKNNSLLNKSVKVVEQSEENTKKRKKTITDDEIITKKSKQEIQEVEILDEIPLDSKLGSNLNLETPPTPPSSHKDSSDEGPTSNKFKSKTRSGKHGVFEVFCERNKESAEQLDPDASEADIKAYLLDLWENMSSQERNKYRADYLQSDEVQLYSIDEDEDEEDDEDEDEDEDDDDDDYDDDEEAESEPEPEKSSAVNRRRRTKGQSKIDEFFNHEEPSEKATRRQRSKAGLNTTKDEFSDQEEEETTSVESENLDKSVKKRRTKARRESSDQDDVISIDSGDVPVKKRRSKVDNESLKDYPPALMIDTGKRHRPYKLFKGMKNERVCQICEKTGKLIRCRGPCHSYFHLACVKPGESSPEPSEAGDIDENNAYKEDLKEIKEKSKEIQEKEEETVFDYDNFKCIDCLSGVAPPCFVCHERDGERTKCSILACGKHYHPDCLKSWPQCQWQGGRLTCPHHICHTCASDNPQNSHPRSAGEKFVKCVKCPSTYHASISCLPAGSSILTGSQIVCPKHYKSSHPPVNATWCFLCTEGGSLICCDTCPTSFHLECLGIDAPDGGYICEDCETGRLPLYGEVVWVKLGTYRWWPSVICYPQEIPTNIATRPHKTGEFCVMFLGTRDYYWIHRGKAFLYQDGDANTKVIGSKKVEESYRKALQEAKLFHERLVYERAVAKDRGSSKSLKPPPYVKLKVNKPVGNVKVPEVDSMVACDCNPNQPYPCSPDSDCLNRILMIECSPDTCPAGTKCQNQLFVQRKYPAMKPVHTEERGWGLVSLEPIKHGQFIIEYVGEVIDEAEYKLRLQQKRERKNENYYFLTIDNTRMIDAEPKGNLSRFMNHSCQPNCETQKWTVNGDTRIGLFALRDIEPGEELTFNYNLACDGETRKPCLCKAPNCSGFIGLKVPKQQMSLVQQKKIEKAEKVKKQRKNNKKVLLSCWNCSQKIDNPDDAHRCDQKTCGKVYHAHCIAIEDGPDHIFHCPWHFCAECYKRTAIRCSYCCNAFCQLHVFGNLREDPETASLICYNHQTENGDYIDIDMGESGEALMDDDGDDDVVIINDDYNSVEMFCDQVLEEPLEPPPPLIPLAAPPSPTPVVMETAASCSVQPDEISPRGAIVEVHASSEEGEEEDESSSQKEDDEDESADNKRRRRRRQRRKQNAAESDLTLDQIAAIIGIVK